MSPYLQCEPYMRDYERAPRACIDEYGGLPVRIGLGYLEDRRFAIFRKQ